METNLFLVKGSKSNVAGDLIHDMKAATETLGRTVVKKPLKKQNICLDKGYDYPEIEKESTKRRYLPHSSHRGVEKELIKIEYVTKRWIVERTNSWHNRFRKLLVRYERNQRTIFTSLFSLLYYCLQEDNFRIGSYYQNDRYLKNKLT